LEDTCQAHFLGTGGGHGFFGCAEELKKESGIQCGGCLTCVGQWLFKRVIVQTTTSMYLGMRSPIQEKKLQLSLHFLACSLMLAHAR
jgi:hypothetical protein